MGHADFQKENDYQQKILEFRRVFDVFDTDHDGALSTDELKDLLRKLGKDVTHAEAYSLIDSLDENRNGKLDFREFLQLVTGTDHQRSDLIHAFRAYDKDGNGFITIDEIREALQALGHTYITEEKIEEAISLIDKDGNGQIDFKEFTAMLTQ